MLHPHRQLSRRDIVGVACGTLLLAAVRPTHADGFRSPSGCFIAPEQFAGITVYNGPPQQHAENIDPSREPIIGSSGDQSFDQALGRVLVKISHGLLVMPGFGYYDDSAGKNALAAPVKRVPGTRGTVLFGLAFLDDLLKHRDGDIAVLAVCAHEFAHIHQHETGMMGRLENDLPKYCKELSADFLAGYFLGLFRSERPEVSVQGVGQVWEGLGSSDFNRPGTHGTQGMRVRAIESGYFLAQQQGRNLDAADEEAYRHVSVYG